MLSNWWLNLSWYAGTALNVLIIIAIMKRGLVRQWPSILAYCLLSLAFDGALVAVKHQYSRYFYVYWSWIALASILRLWVLADVLRSFPGGDIIGPRLRLAVASAGGVMAAGAWVVSSHTHTLFSSKILGWALTLDRCVAIAWGAFLVAAMLGIWLFRLGWDRIGALIANGLALKIAGWIVSSYILSLILDHPVRHIGQFVEAYCSSASLLVWFYAVALPEAVEERSEPTETEQFADTREHFRLTMKDAHHARIRP